MVAVPTDLKKALAAHKKAQAVWPTLTPTAQRDFVSWIVGAKQAATRKGRIEKACSMLASGKRRPCCYAVVPMNLYKALNENVKAKTVWKALSPDEKRDLVAWIDQANSPEVFALRIQKVCAALRQGKAKV